MTSPKEKQSNQLIDTGMLSWDTKPEEKAPTTIEKSSEFDWGSSLTDNKVKTDDFEIKWSDDEDACSDDSGGGLTMKIGKKEEEEEDDEPEEQSKEKHIDIMAQQLKFVACLKILMEELSTLATGFEVDGKRNNEYFIIFNIIILQNITYFFSVNEIAYFVYFDKYINVYNNSFRYYM